MRPCCRKAKQCFHSSQITSQSMTNTYHTYIRFFFTFSYTLSLAVSLLSVCISVSCLFLSHTHTHRWRRRCSAVLWQQPVSSVNDLWRVSRCVSLGSLRFVSTVLYLKAPFMGPQVWLPSPQGDSKGSCQIPVLHPHRTVMESRWASWGSI